ncbi:hypothetical protein GW835_01375 [archaeon]|nr:hypothetical protein [archaeon]NCP79202.1 hypothetical protein [archaeon]NCP97851.1 hypothetical protein [archaeon]NCQ06969.1 hypothetical protein [archaeon]NCQ50765.1 hypothetical protein [archaeon]
MNNKDLLNSLFKQSYFCILIFIFFLFFTPFIYASDFESNLYLLEKDYNLLKNEFNNYLLDFPLIDFSIIDANDSLRYEQILKEYDSLPELKIISEKEISLKKDLNISGYTQLYDSLNISKKEIHLRVISKKDYQDYLFVTYSLHDLNVYYDFPKDIIKTNSVFSESLNKFYIIDRNFSYLTDDFSQSYLPFRLEKIVVYKEEEKDYTLVYFFVIVFLLFIIYSYNYCKNNPNFKNKLKRNIRKIILKIYKKIEKN